MTIKRFVLIAALLLLPLSAFARGHLVGYVERGGQTVLVGASISSTKVQRSFPSALVTVYLAGTSTLATIYSDSAGTAKANPFSAATDGYYDLWTDASEVKLRFESGGLPSPLERDHVQIPGGSSSSGGYSIQTYGAVCDGVSDVSAAIVAAYTAVPSTGGDLTVSAGTLPCLIGTSVSIPSKARLVIGNGALLEVAAAVTLTIGGPVDIGRYQVFSLDSATTSIVSFGAVGSSLVTAVYPEWFGSTASSLQRAYDFYAASRAGVFSLASKVYSMGSTSWVIDDDFVRIQGQGPVIGINSANGDPPLGLVLQDMNCTRIDYTGTGAAIQIGKNFGGASSTSNELIDKVEINHLYVTTSNSSAHAFDAWKLANSRWTHIAAYYRGSASAQAAGHAVRIRGGINNVIDNAIFANYNHGLLVNSFSLGLNFAGAAATTTSLKDSWIYGCDIGVEANGSILGLDLENTIIETCDNYGIASTGASIHARHVWLENTPLLGTGNGAQLYLAASAGPVPARVWISDSYIGMASNQQYMGQLVGSTGPSELHITSSEIISAHATPRMFDPTVSTAAGTTVSLRDDQIKTPALRVSDGTYPSTVFGGNAVSIGQMQRVVYRFNHQNIPVNTTTTIATSETRGAVTELFTYTAPQAGDIIGVQVRFSAAISSGTYGYIVLKNGSGVISETGLSAGRIAWAEHFRFPFVAGDTIAVSIVTTAVTFAATPTVCTVEVITAQGDDGI